MSAMQEAADSTGKQHAACAVPRARMQRVERSGRKRGSKNALGAAFTGLALMER
jgi:hypothetical protein